MEVAFTIRSFLAFIIRYIRLFCFRILRQGPIPNHVAFIMDGNRRYAELRGLLTKFQGHIHGYRKLEEVLEWCFELGIHAVTVYAFSIENFRRPVEEVNAIMDLVMEKFHELGQRNDIITRNKVAIRVIGELDLLPPHIKEAAESVMRRTCNYRRFILNICFPYTATAECISICNELIEVGLPITRDSIDTRLYTNPAPPLDLLVRTSGELRLSEFLTWQITSPTKRRPYLVFLDALWPSFNFLNYIYVLLRYQLHHKREKKTGKDQCLRATVKVKESTKVTLPTPPHSPIYLKTL